MEVKRIAIISRGVYPIPAIKGGAVEGLIDVFIKEINQNNDFLLDVYTINDDYLNNKKVKNVSYIYINNSLIYKFKKITRGLLNKVSNKYIGNQFLKSCINRIKKTNLRYDIFLIENSPEYSILLKKEFPDTIIFQHLHNDYLDNNVRYSVDIKKTTDYYLAISKFIQYQISKFDNENKVFLWYNTLSLPNNDSKIIDIRKIHNISDSTKIILYTGRLQPHKGIKELILAFINVKYNDSTLVIVGGDKYSDSSKSKYTDELFSLAKKSHNRILFTGFIPHNMIKSYYSVANIFVIPSLWKEPFGLTCLEAMSYSLPIIASNKGALPELISKEFLINVDDDYINSLTEKMDFLLNNKIICDDVGHKNYLKSLKFNNKVFYEDFVKILNKI